VARRSRKAFWLERVGLRRAYPLLGIALALGAPLGLLIVRMVETSGPFGLVAVIAEIHRNAITYAYLTFSTMFMFVLLGVVLGAKQDHMRSLMMTDPLTGLFNRRYLQQRLLDELARVARYGGNLSLLVIDVDHLKQINDGLGHEAGDRALRRVAKAIQRSLRATDSAARYGGDEFAVLCPATTARESLRLSRRIRMRLDDLAAETHTTVSIGVADLAYVRAKNSRELFEAADRALYEAKNAGRDSIRIARLADAALRDGPELTHQEEAAS
jgi:diguanylate cyclase (GGDEF)-like protein